jgi:ankyrin repeat protein
MSDNQQQQRVDSAICDVVSDAIDGNVDAVRKWLHGDGRDNVKKQAQVLNRAAVKGHIDICQLVIDCDTVSTDDMTRALHQACYYGQLSVVRLIVSTFGHHGNSELFNESLHAAASRCHTKVVNWLQSQTNPPDADFVRWDLVLESARGDLTRVTQLVNTIGPDVTDVMSHALWAACYKGRVDIADWLMTHTSADVNYSRVIYFNTGNMTSLAIACYEGHMTVVKRLLAETTSQRYVDTVTGERGNTALHEVIWHSQMTPLHEACHNGDTAAVVDVIDNSDVNMQDGVGRTAMHLACVSGRFDIVKVLLSQFADTNITNDKGRTPAAVCEFGGSPELATYLQQLDHVMYVPDDGEGNITVSGQVDNNTDTQVTLEDSVVVTSGNDKDEYPTSENENS